MNKTQHIGIHKKTPSDDSIDNPEDNHSSKDPRKLEHFKNLDSQVENMG